MKKNNPAAKTATARPSAPPSPASAKPTAKSPAAAAAKSGRTAKPAPAAVASPAPGKASTVKRAKAQGTKRTRAVADAPVSVATVVPPPPVVTIVARIDVAWGNQLFLRGEGEGLTWEKGVAMTCLGGGEWVWISPPNAARHTFKFVLNDIFWEQGDNHRAALGETVIHSPQF